MSYRINFSDQLLPTINVPSYGTVQISESFAYGRKHQNWGAGINRNALQLLTNQLSTVAPVNSILGEKYHRFVGFVKNINTNQWFQFTQIGWISIVVDITPTTVESYYTQSGILYRRTDDTWQPIDYSELPTNPTLRPETFQLTYSVGMYQRNNIASYGTVRPSAITITTDHRLVGFAHDVSGPLGHAPLNGNLSLVGGQHITYDPATPITLNQTGVNKQFVDETLANTVVSASTISTNTNTAINAAVSTALDVLFDSSRAFINDVAVHANAKSGYCAASSLPDMVTPATTKLLNANWLALSGTLFPNTLGNQPVNHPAYNVAISSTRTTPENPFVFFITDTTGVTISQTPVNMPFRLNCMRNVVTNTSTHQGVTGAIALQVDGNVYSIADSRGYFTNDETDVIFTFNTQDVNEVAFQTLVCTYPFRIVPNDQGIVLVTSSGTYNRFSASTVTPSLDIQFFGSVDDTTYAPVTSINEGYFLRVDGLATNLPAGTVLYYNVTTPDTIDIVEAASDVLTGSVVINALGSFVNPLTFKIRDDSATEGPEQFTIVFNDTYVDYTDSITINDTSTNIYQAVLLTSMPFRISETLATYSQTGNLDVPTVYEGDEVILIVVISGNFTDGTELAWTIDRDVDWSTTPLLKYTETGTRQRFSNSSGTLGGNFIITQTGPNQYTGAITYYAHRMYVEELPITIQRFQYTVNLVDYPDVEWRWAVLRGTNGTFAGPDALDDRYTITVDGMNVNAAGTTPYYDVFLPQGVRTEVSIVGGGGGGGQVDTTGNGGVTPQSRSGDSTVFTYSGVGTVTATGGQGGYSFTVNNPVATQHPIGGAAGTRIVSGVDDAYISSSFYSASNTTEIGYSVLPANSALPLTDLGYGGGTFYENSPALKPQVVDYKYVTFKLTRQFFFGPTAWDLNSYFQEVPLYSDQQWTYVPGDIANQLTRYDNIFANGISLYGNGGHGTVVDPAFTPQCPAHAPQMPSNPGSLYGGNINVPAGGGGGAGGVVAFNLIHLDTRNTFPGSTSYSKLTVGRGGFGAPNAVWPTGGSATGTRRGIPGASGACNVHWLNYRVDEFVNGGVGSVWLLQPGEEALFVLIGGGGAGGGVTVIDNIGNQPSPDGGDGEPSYIGITDSPFTGTIVQADGGFGGKGVRSNWGTVIDNTPTGTQGQVGNNVRLGLNTSQNLTFIRSSGGLHELEIYEANFVNTPVGGTFDGRDEYNGQQNIGADVVATPTSNGGKGYSLPGNTMSSAGNGSHGQWLFRNEGGFSYGAPSDLDYIRYAQGGGAGGACSYYIKNIGLHDVTLTLNAGRGGNGSSRAISGIRKKDSLPGSAGCIAVYRQINTVDKVLYFAGSTVSRTFTVPVGYRADILMIAGGGGGGSSYNTADGTPSSASNGTNMTLYGGSIFVAALGGVAGTNGQWTSPANFTSGTGGAGGSGGTHSFGIGDDITVAEQADGEPGFIFGGNGGVGRAFNFRSAQHATYGAGGNGGAGFNGINDEGRGGGGGAGGYIAVRYTNDGAFPVVFTVTGGVGGESSISTTIAPGNIHDGLPGQDGFMAVLLRKLVD